MKRNQLQLVLFCLMLSVSRLYAGESDSLTLRECMEFAVQNSPRIKIHKTKQSDAQVQRREAILQAFTPRIMAGSSVYYNFGRAVDPESNTYTDVTSFNNNYALNANLTLFDGFVTINHIRLAKTIIKMGISEEQKLRNELCLAVMEAYFNVQYHAHMLSALTAQVDAAKENVKLVAIQYEQGQKGYADKVQMEANLAEKEYQCITSENQRDEALLTLKDIMLWPVDEALPLQPVPLASEDATSLFTTEEVSPLTSDEIRAYARQFHPTALLAKREMEKAQLDLKSARGAFFPVLSLGGGWSTNYYTYPGKDDYHAPSFSSQFSNNRGSYVQLSLTFPIYDCLSRSSNLARKKNAFRRAEITYDQTQRDIESEVSRAIQDCKGAFKASIQAEKQAAVQRESFRLGQRKVAQGLMSPIEFHSLSSTFLQAKSNQLNAQLTYLLKQSVVNYYKGISYIDQLK